MPYPGVNLFPSPLLFPGPGAVSPPFAAIVADSTAPWNDSQGHWAAYNQALATMFEQVYDFVADLGDVSQTTVATLSADVAENVLTTQFPVWTVSEPIAAGTAITVAAGPIIQAFTTTVPASPGDTVIDIIPETTTFAFPAGSPVQLAYSPGWSILLDPNETPFVQFLAQFNGTPVPSDLDSATARTKVISESGLTRGTSTAVLSAIQRHLAGTQFIDLLERTSASGNADPYFFIVVVRPEEVVGGVNLIKPDVDAVKPGGVQWLLIVTDGWIISQMEASEPVLSALEADFKTLVGLENDIRAT